MKVLKTLFEEKLVTDTREPVITFAIPTYEGEFGLFTPQACIWKQLVNFVLLQTLVQCVFAVMIYTHIVKTRGAIGSRLLGWGIIIPAGCILPFTFLEYFDIQNKILKYGATNTMAVIVFKCIEAMYDTHPSPAIEASIWDYIMYYTTRVPFAWDSKTKGWKRVDFKEIFNASLWLLSEFHIYSLLLSFMMHHNFKPFPNDTVEEDQYNLNFDIFTPQHLANGYFMIVLLYLHLAFGFNLVGLSVKLQGYSTVSIFRNPLFKSRTPTEFWTKRWNMMIHQTLKYGVFLPLRKIIQPKVAIIVTFIVSGLFHDYVWACTFYYQKHFYDESGCHGCHKPIFGRVTAFFLLTGVFILLERPVSKLPIVSYLSKFFPTCIISILLVLIHVPFAHWYYGDWIHGGYFNDFSIGLWHIKKL